MNSKDNNKSTQIRGHVAILIVFSVMLKTFNILFPKSVVYDELYTVKFVKSYFTRAFLFDVHPPFTKLIIALFVYIFRIDLQMVGYIGEVYKPSYTGHVILRSISVILQITSLIFTYKTLSFWLSSNTSLLISMFVLFETAFHIHYSLIIGDTYIYFYNTMMLYAFSRYYFTRSNTSLLMLGIFYSMSISSKFTALFSVMPYLLWLIYDLYVMAIDKERPLFIGRESVLYHSFYRFLCLIALPIGIYLASFYIHFKLQRIYSEDAEIFSLGFQSYFENNLLEESDKFILDRSVVTIINKENMLYIKSEEKNYEKGSQEQIVYADAIKNENAIWQLVKVYYEGLDKTPFIKNGNYIKIVNLLTEKYLRTHNVFAENSYEKKFREVCCHGSQSIGETDDNDIWIIKSADDQIITRKSEFKLIHPATGLFLGVNALPESKRHDVYGSVDGAHKYRYFYFEDNKIDNHFKSSVKEPEIKEKICDYPTPKFFNLLYEYHCKMLSENNKINGNRIFASKPWKWIEMQKGILYWNSYYADDKKQGGRIIYFIGNKINWIISNCVFILPFIMLIHNAMRIRGYSKRQCPFILHMALMQFAFNFLPFFLFKRELYLTHYLPAYFYGLLAGLIMISFMGNKILLILLTLSFSHFYRTKSFLGLPMQLDYCNEMGLGDVCQTL